MPTQERKKLPSRGPPEGSPRASPDATSTITDPHVPRYSGLINEAWNAANAEQPQARGVERFLNSVGKVQDTMALSDGQQTVVDTLAVPAKALLDIPQIADDITDGVNTFMEVVPVLMKALDGLATIHPFIAVAVTAFKAVYTLEMTRRNNDQRVIAIYVEMKDMMAVLIQLEGVSDPRKVAPNGQTIEGRMQELCANVAEDIKRCANTCDTYLKKKILTKIFSGAVWEKRLVEFVEVFTNRRKEFTLALSIHTAVAVGEGNIKLNAIVKRTTEIIQRMGVMTKLFQEKFVTPEQRRLTFLVKQKGGDAVIHDKQAMMELWNEEVMTFTLVGNERHRSTKNIDLKEILREIQCDPTKAIEKNEESFYGKLRVQMRQIREDVERTGDRVISVLTGGPHDRIVDPELRQIWKEMRWRGSVKARNFVLALKDHYTEMVAGDSGGTANPEEWALGYININWVRKLVEALDGDASGFVTIKEVNDFTCSRPLDWSLPHWLAYWAIGWQMTCTGYCKRIEEIFDAMIRLADEVLPENRKGVNEYICDVWTEVCVFTRSIKREEGTDVLRTRFQSYVDEEEERLEKNLEDTKHYIDSCDSVRLVSGHRRIEATLFPMLYLLLRRDLQKISLARKYVLSESEFFDALSTIQRVITGARCRILDLRVIFEQQGLSPKEQFAIHAGGLYSMSSEGGCLPRDEFRTLPDLLRDPLSDLIPDSIPAESEIIPNQDSVPLSILNYPPGNKHEIDFAAYDPPTSVVPPSVDGPDAVLGTYYGFIYVGGKPLGPMRSWTLNRGSEENSVVASGTHYRSRYHEPYTLTGTTGTLDGEKMSVDLKINYSTGRQYIATTGHFDPEENSLRGTARWLDGSLGEFVFKRNPTFVRFYPAPSIIDARARWKFAITVILDRIRQQSWSPPYILKRIKEGKRYMELTLKDEWHPKKSLDDGDSDEYHNLLSSLYEADARFYASRINIKLSETTIHPVNCDFCGATLVGARVLCTDCRGRNTLNLCSVPECLDSVVTLDQCPGLEVPHTPNHDVLTVHRILFDRDTARTERNARNALVAARNTISGLEAEKLPMPGCVCCRNVVPFPCWYCVDCVGEKFICATCEHGRLAFNDTHTKKHTLVRVNQKVKKSKVSMEERLETVEGQLGSVKEQLGSVMEQLGSVEGQLGSVQEELSKMRWLFSKLFEKGMGGFSSDLTKGGVLDAAMVESSPGGPLLAKGEGNEGVGKGRD